MSMNMSVNNRLKKSRYGIFIEVPDRLIEELVLKNQKPPEVLSNFITKLSNEEDVDDIIAYSRGVEKKKKLESIALSPNNNDSNKAWSYKLFDEYMKLLVRQSKIRASVGDLISMLIAYYRTSSRPSSEELREARYFEPGDKWYEELRVAKSRLTIAAKHLGLPSFFLRAYGSSLKRKHPIDDEIYTYLIYWFRENDAVLNEYEQLPTPRALI